MNADELLDADITSFNGYPTPLMTLLEKHIVTYK